MLVRGKTYSGHFDLVQPRLMYDFLGGGQILSAAARMMKSVMSEGWQNTPQA
jgi:hypothetical protein